MTEASAHIRRAEESDAAALADLAARTFVQSYGPDNLPENIDLYLERSFNREQILSELLDPGTHYLLANSDERPIAYATLRESPAPETGLSGRAIELARIYVEADLIGVGIGSLLMRNCLLLAREQDFDTIWLGVWRHNSRAVGFYRKWKFEVVGTQNFVLGRDVQVDYLMARPVELPDKSPADTSDRL